MNIPKPHHVFFSCFIPFFCCPCCLFACFLVLFACCFLLSCDFGKRSGRGRERVEEKKVLLWTQQRIQMIHLIQRNKIYTDVVFVLFCFILFWFVCCVVVLFVCFPGGCEEFAFFASGALFEFGGIKI